mmetsp:Transcript_2180/g.2403  ORF Transcript_2180/g.2403 Transcript_2180/m.2403 type:complete len:132 (-) Transcript_2180:116-511(-)|eukprot:Skav203462  [mRNA]  locus=scaffold2161:131699:132094:+ [translate_table: standard]
MGSCLSEASLAPSLTEEMSEERLKEIAKDFAGKSDHPIEPGCKMQGDWAIVKKALETKSEDDFYAWGLFHVPSWKPGAKPVLTASFTDLSHVGCKGNGEQLIFGASGEVLKVDGNDRSAVKEKFQLQDLVP